MPALCLAVHVDADGCKSAMIVLRCTRRTWLANCAGLKRLGQADRATAVLGTDVLLPAACQGAVGVMVRRNDDELRRWVLHTGVVCLVSAGRQASGPAAALQQAAARFDTFVRVWRLAWRWLAAESEA